MRSAGRPTSCGNGSTATRSAMSSPATSTTPTSAISAASSAPSRRASSAKTCAAGLTTSISRRSSGGSRRPGSAAPPKSACRAASTRNIPARPISRICRAIKEAVPDIHIHAFSPLEIWQGAKTLGRTLPDFLRELKAAGLSSLPGTAAEILDDEVRAVICPDKIKTGQWLEVMEAAHAVGLRSTVTIMYGHVDRYEHWARHLLRIRALQARTGGFTEFVPLPFVPMETPIYLKGRARRGPTYREAVLMHAVARLVLHPVITNIQTSWVKMGSGGAAACLDGRRQRSRRHPDEREHHPRRRRGARPGDAAREHGGADPLVGRASRASARRSTPTPRPSGKPPRSAPRRSPSRSTRRRGATSGSRRAPPPIKNFGEESMEIEAAVFRKVHEPLTIEAVEIDKPWGREVLVRTVGDRRLPQRSARRRRRRAVPARPADRARPRGRRRRRGGRRRCDHGQAGRSRRRLPFGFLRQLPAMPFRASEFVHRRHRHAARQRGRRGCRRRASRCASSSASRAMPRRCCCTRIRW